MEPNDNLTNLLASTIDAWRGLNPDVTVGDVLKALETIRHKLTEGLIELGSADR